MAFCARIKQDLLRAFNLHTIVRLPKGVFSPYTDIPTNILFFDISRATKDIWFYEHPLPEGRKAYTKTRPLAYADFKNCLDWWTNRTESDRAWRVPVAGLSNDVNLDQKNPRAKADPDHMPPSQLLFDIRSKEQRISDLMNEIEALLLSGQ